MKICLLSDSKIISNYNGIDIEWLNTSIYSTDEILNQIEDHQPSVLFVYAELLIKNVTLRTRHFGIDLIKHIRLTPLKNNLHKLPIILFHWHSIEFYIKSDIENLILYSPGIARIQLPQSNTDFDIPTPLNENISSFLFRSNSDEEISEHQFRNEIAINQFENESFSGKKELKDKPLWYKKLYYQQGYFFAGYSDLVTKSDTNIKLLLIDDMGEKWKPALQNVLPNASIELCTSIAEAETKISSVQKKKNELRNSFAVNTDIQFQIASTINDKNQELKIISDKLTTEKNKLSNNINNIDKVKEQKKSNENELKKLLEDLTKNDGIFDALLSFKTEEINANTKKDISNLSQFITNISNARENIISATQLIDECNQNIRQLSIHKLNIEQELQNFKSSLQDISYSISQSFESLFIGEVDLILLDMHLTKDSESKESKQMDGYRVLSALKSSSLNIPTIIFSATKKNLADLLNEFDFLYKSTFLKGITPVNNFIILINNLEINNHAKRLENILDEVIIFSSYKYREYQAYDSPEYETKEVTLQNRSRIIEQIRTIQSDLRNYTTNHRISYLQNIILKLGNIIREHRYRVLAYIHDRNNSLFHIVNSRKNGISSQCSELIYWRNKTEHLPENQQEKVKYNEWLNKLDLNEIEKHIKIVYEGLIFDK